MDIKKLQNDALNACTIWQFDQPALSELNALFNLYKQQYELLVANKLKKPAQVAFEAWLLSTSEQLNSGYLWTSACPILTSLIVNRLKSEATNSMKLRANERASLVGLSYTEIAEIIEEASKCSYRSALKTRQKPVTPAEKKRIADQERRSREIQALKTGRTQTREVTRETAREIERPRSTYKAPSSPMSHCTGGGGPSSPSWC